ncbi:RNA polymerase sigma factor [Sphingobium cloacae]|uniref:Sigma-70 family RNA polymerase sigma factor n=1 Tax=Sphingobium cloacae TaxID=120107 RepID=A0A1E1F4A3_9SPHN|nr:RNA polymerase sigma factor [Sphingobium cloacae]BAV65354.1 sigma-70 family RNA polymerase sigma factor [Sphingobium cloacae]
MLDQGKALRVYQEQHARLLNCASRILGDAVRAEDIVHDAWIAVTARIGDEDVREFGGYLYSTVRNLAIDALRRERKYDEIAGGNFEAAAVNVPDASPPVDVWIADAQELDRFRQALARLPERQRIAVEMHRVGNFKLRDIAGRLGVSVGYAQELVMKGIAFCAEYLEEGH